MRLTTGRLALRRTRRTLWVGTAGAVVPVVPSSTATGGNLVKPRLHQGNYPGRKQQTGHTELVYRLTITGTGQIETPAALALPAFTATGEVTAGHRYGYTVDAHHEHTICHREHLDLIPARTYHGTASEDAEDVLLLLVIGD